MQLVLIDPYTCNLLPILIMMKLPSFPWAPTSCKDGTCGKCVICNVDGESSSGQVPLGASGSFAAQCDELDSQLEAEIQDAQNDEVEAQIQARPQHVQIQEPLTTESMRDSSPEVSLSESINNEQQRQLQQNQSPGQTGQQERIPTITQKMRESLITDGDLSSCEESSVSKSIYEQRQHLQQYQNSGGSQQQKSAPSGAQIQSARTVQAGAPRNVLGAGHLNSPRVELGMKRHTSTIFSKATLSKSSSIGDAIDDLDFYGEMGERNANYRRNMAANHRLSIHENGKDGENSIFEVRMRVMH